MGKFWVKTGGRLHLGQLDLNGSLGRLYGGLGLAIDQPQLEIAAEKNEGLALAGPEESRLEVIIRQYLAYYHLPGVKIDVVQALPSHSGLGSGTQLSLALGFAITRVYGLAPSLAELAAITDRESSRSGIGVAAFERGGFLVDGGKPIEEAGFTIPPVLARFHFPEEWAVILAIPYTNAKIYGAKEQKAFKSLPPMDEEISGNICRILLMKLLPGLLEKNLKSFGQAVTEIQKLLGGYFAPFQGGVYASVQGRETAEYLQKEGAAGVGQSSWGPAVYGFIRREEQNKLLKKMENFLGGKGQVWAVSGRNHGANWGWE